MKKGFILGLTTGVVLTGASLVLANSQIQAILNDQIKVTLNGQVQEFKDETTNETQYPITYHDRTYLPLRTVANLVGVDVDYDASSNTAILNNSQSAGKTASDVSPTNITVEDAVNYTDGYYHLFKVRLPKVNGNTNIIKELNQKILDEVLPITYSDVASHAIISESLDKGSEYDYRYIIKDNILVIDVYSTIPDGGSVVPASGGGLHEFSYYYDITNDKILTLSEASSKLSLSLNGLTALDGTSISSYDELEKNHYMITISNNDLKLEFFN